MSKYLFLGAIILSVGVFFLYIFKCERHFNKFQEEMKVEDLCYFYDGEEKLIGTILEIKNGYASVISLDGKALFKIKKEEIYPI